MEYIYLSLILGYGTASAAKVLKSLNGNQDILALNKEKAAALGFTKTQISRINGQTQKEAERIFNLCQKENIRVIDYFSKDYPLLLKKIKSPPTVIYVLGKKIDFNKGVFLSVIGSRKISEYGKKSAFSLSARLSLAGANIVSGGALGGDTYAGLGAMAAGGKTVTVTAGGVLTNYLASNQKFRKQVVESGGVLVSEFPPDYMPNKGSFVIRNRIVAGLSHGVCVVEAAIKSGTLITAKCALEENRQVFALPGLPTDRSHQGTNSLLLGGAIPLTGIDVILKEYKSLNKTDLQKLTSQQLLNEYNKISGNNTVKKNTVNVNKEQPESNVAKTPPQPLFGLEKEVYNAINGLVTVDDILEKVNHPISSVLITLTSLELKGAIKSLPGSRFKKIKE